jgi:hypothetical protein
LQSSINGDRESTCHMQNIETDAFLMSHVRDNTKEKKDFPMTSNSKTVT